MLCYIRSYRPIPTNLSVTFSSGKLWWKCWSYYKRIFPCLLLLFLGVFFFSVVSFRSLYLSGSCFIYLIFVGVWFNALCNINVSAVIFVRNLIWDRMEWKYLFCVDIMTTFHWDMIWPLFIVAPINMSLDSINPIWLIDTNNNKITFSHSWCMLSLRLS